MPYLSTTLCDEPLSPTKQSSKTRSHSVLAKSSLIKNATNLHASQQSETTGSTESKDQPHLNGDLVSEPSQPSHHTMSTSTAANSTLRPPPRDYRKVLSDTPASTAPNSPQIPPKRQNSSGVGVRARPTTLDIPGLTKSNISPDGRIASDDIGSKLVIVMVGLPARGKSYITKKLARYLNWLQHDTKIFNVGERRRVAASGHSPSVGPITDPLGTNQLETLAMVSATAMKLTPDGQTAEDKAGDFHSPGINIPDLLLPEAQEAEDKEGRKKRTKSIDQSASFFDPNNREASRIREQCALDTLDELLHYILEENGSIGILDATNSTLHRRKLITKYIQEKVGAHLNILFIESMCLDEDLLDRNMRLKLSGPDYRDKDPVASLVDFKERVRMYEHSYVPLGAYEDRNNISYVQMIDVGRKIISHQIKGFLSSQAVYYLLNFNLAPRQIWVTRHGESEDNLAGRLGGDSNLTEYGRLYAEDLATFLEQQRKEWEVHELDKRNQAHASPLPGTSTPPNPHYPPDGDDDHIIQKPFCVWTSMLKRSVQTAQFFNNEEFDIKQMRMLDEINAGFYEGLTYEQIKDQHAEEYKERRRDKLRYRYPGPGGEGYLDVINRLRPVIVELERMTDHVLLIGHRSIARVLLAYFKGLRREEVADLDVPIGILFSISPKPYGIDFKAYRHNDQTRGFDVVPDYQLQTAKSD